MTVTLSTGLVSVNPELALPYEFEYSQTTIVHEVPGRPFPDVTLRPAGPRSGTLQLLFIGHSAALAAAALHLDGDVLTLEDTTTPAMDMSYVAVDRTRLVQQESVHPWMLLVPFQEVDPS